MEKRLISVFSFFIIIFLLIIYRLFYWQLIKSESLKGLSQSQLDRTLEIKASRGRIYTRDGSPLVINAPAFQIYAEPQNLDASQQPEKVLAENLNIDEASISSKLKDSKSKWVSIAEKVDAEIIDSLKEFNLSGVGYLEDNKRYYPEASMAAHLIGFVGKDHNGQDKGYFGIEGYYDEQLKGRNGTVQEEKDAFGNPILAGARQVLPSTDGTDLYLTVDKTVQFTIEKSLEDGIQKYGASRGSIIVMNPQSGEILGMASYPSYDLSTRTEYDEEYYKNPAISLSYEPGSTFKILIMAAAVNEGSVSSKDEFLEQGPVKVGEYSVKTWNQQYHGLITIPEIIQYSSNVGMVYIAEKLGQDKLFSYLQKFNLGQLTGVDLQEEATPSLRDAGEWYPIDYATASFGQGIAVTPLQMISLSSSIANGGNIITPYIVDHLVTDQGKEIKIHPQSSTQVFKKNTSSIVKEMMVNAVEKGETKFLKPLGVRIAGKTGTAQIPIAGHYDSDKTIASFIGFLPADNPQIIMLVTLTEPTSSPWGSETAAPLFFNITNELISYLNIPGIQNP